MRKNKHIIILLVLFVSLVVFEYMKPKEIDWTISFKKEDKIPFGSYIMYDLLEDVFADGKIETNDYSPFKVLKHKEVTNTTYIVITQKFAPVKVNMNAFFDFVKRGNKLFVSALDFGDNIMDSLHFTTNTLYLSFLKKDSLNCNFFNVNLKNDSSYYIKSLAVSSYIDSMDSRRAKKIAYVENEKSVFFRQKYGKGEFLISVQPLAYTNYNILLGNNLQYVLKTLSFANNKRIIWDKYYAYNKYNRSAMSYIISQKSLRIAWYLLLILAFVYLFFGSKRKQKVIPIIEKPANTSLDFVKTLSNLYLSNKNHKDIAQKKYYYWLSYLRKKYFLKIENNQAIIDIDLISEKTMVDKSIIRQIINDKREIDLSKTISSDNLLKFNDLIDKFYSTCS